MDYLTPTHQEILDVLNQSGVLCEDVVQQNYPDWQGEMSRTIAHESVHVAQVCKVPNGYFYPLGFKNDVEKEAFAIQDQPREVLRILKKYCL